MDNDFATGYALGVDSNSGGGNSGGWGGGFGDWIIILLLFALLGGNGLGFGGWGGGGGSGFQGMATRADINEGFALNNITSGIQAIQHGICDSTYTLSNAISGGFNQTNMGMMQGFNSLGQQLSDCCCENRAAIAQVRYDMATQACDTRNLIQTTTRDLIDNQNANFRALMDYQVQREMREKDAKIAELQNAALQAQQNAFFTANQEAQTAELVRRLRTPEAVPAYVVPNPNCCYGNPLGVGYQGQGGCGCGLAA